MASDVVTDGGEQGEADFVVTGERIAVLRTRKSSSVAVSALEGAETLCGVAGKSQISWVLGGKNRPEQARDGRFVPSGY